MKLILHTSTRLKFRTGFPLLNTTTCDLDRETGRALIMRVMLAWRRKPIDVPLGDIVSAQVASLISKIEDGDVATAIPQLTLASGENVNLSVLTGDTKTAPKAIGLINAFLQLR